MFDTSLCPSRDDPLKVYSILFPNKLNTQEFIYCAMKKYCSVRLSWNTRRSPSIFICFKAAISNSTRSTENNILYGRKTDRATTIWLNPPDRATTISRLITMERTIARYNMTYYVLLISITNREKMNVADDVHL